MARQAKAAKASRAAAVRTSGDPVQSLVRALALLNRIADAPDAGASLTELAQQVGLPASTAHRLLTTLEQERYVRFDHDGRLWSVGVQAFVAGCAFTKTRSLTALARPHMRQLMEESGETVNLAIEDEGRAVYLAQVECRQMMRAFARPGSRVPLHCSGVGKAILSAASDKSLAKTLHRHGMPQLTIKTLTSPTALRADLERTPARPDMRSMTRSTRSACAASPQPVFDETGDVVGAVSASGPMARIVDERGRAAGHAGFGSGPGGVGGDGRGADPRLNARFRFEADRLR